MASLFLNLGLILNAALLILTIDVTQGSPIAENISPFKQFEGYVRPPNCYKCTPRDFAKCPEVIEGPDCQVVPEPNCGCCTMCAKKIGERCGVAHGYCDNSGFCLPPPQSQEDYDQYGPADYIAQSENGEFICTDKTDYEILINDYFDEHILDTFGEDYFPSVEPTLPEVPSKPVTVDGSHSNPIIPSLRPVFESSNSPPKSPFKHAKNPCAAHTDHVFAKKHMDRHEWVPVCANRKYYAPEQCEVSFGLELGRCWCVDSYGNPISDYIARPESSDARCRVLLKRG